MKKYQVSACDVAKGFYVRDWTNRIHVKQNGATKTIELETAIPKFRKVLRVLIDGPIARIRVEGLPREIVKPAGELMEVFA